VEVTVEPQRNRTQHSEIQELVDRALRESA
jgi:hypothetical protein